MRRPKLKMKSLLIICLLLISMAAIVNAQSSAQSSGKHRASLNRAQTLEAERRLADMGYWTGVVDGRFDPATRSALIAFQKWEGRSVTGRLTPDEIEAIRTAS